MTSDDWAYVINYLLDAQFQLFTIVYPIYWAIKIVKRVLSA